MVTVTVTGPGGVSTTSSADEFTYGTVPAVTGISPASGPAAGGTTVTITGTGFTGATAVDFGATAATSFTINSAGRRSRPRARRAAGDRGRDGRHGRRHVHPSLADKFTISLGVTGVSSTQAAGHTRRERRSRSRSTFSTPVKVAGTGTPQLTLKRRRRVANYTSGSGTATLTFTYTVAAGQSTRTWIMPRSTALALNGGTIDDAAGNAATLTLPATGTDGLAAQNIVIVPMSDGFESGNFSALPWQLSSAGASPANWTVEAGTVQRAHHAGSYAAQSGAVGASSSSTLSVTLTWRPPANSPSGASSSASGSGSLIFEIDGVRSFNFRRDALAAIVLLGRRGTTHVFLDL